MRIPEPQWYKKSTKYLKRNYQLFFEDKYIQKTIPLFNGTHLKLFPLKKIYGLQLKDHSTHKAETISELQAYSGLSEEKAFETIKNIDNQIEADFMKDYSPNSPELFYQNYKLYYFHLAKTDLEFRHTYFRLNIALSLAKQNHLTEIVDYGAGIGRECIAFSQLGFHATHVDLQGYLSKYAAWRYQKRGLSVDIQSPEEFKNNAKKFDLIFSCDVLEHIPDPMNVIQTWDKKLNAHGYIVTYPDFDNDGTALHLECTRDHLKEFNEFFRLNGYQLLYNKHYCMILKKLSS
ncbi:MAG: hypothetical protein A3B70_07160 [Deltaproteobacteria bacterium RIFCSPHIGHO2_02_FULL_40_11]|nr:MAG: hypothetical protein A3B70_07160 [Deltaproteobacteria bacterium RIFCSPHIGHO2_02_FULL_40_11]